jgi:hypothetical protein
VPTVVVGDFEWDSDKAESNLAKHGVSFEEAASALADPKVVVLDDGSHSGRLLALGFALSGRLLAVIHEERGERDRIVSARPATRRDEQIYSEGDNEP